MEIAEIGSNKLSPPVHKLRGMKGQERNRGQLAEDKWSSHKSR